MWRMRGGVGSGRPSRVPSTRDNRGRGRESCRKMKSSKAAGVSIDMVKAGGEEGVRWMWEVLREV